MGCTPKPSSSTDAEADAAGTTGSFNMNLIYIAGAIILVGLVCFGCFFILCRKGDATVYKGPLASSDPDVERLVEIDAEMKALRKKKRRPWTTTRPIPSRSPLVA